MATISYVQRRPAHRRTQLQSRHSRRCSTPPSRSAPRAGVYEIVNNDGGPFQGFKVQFTRTSTARATSATSITDTDESKPSGTITGMNLRAPDGTIIAQVTPAPPGFGDAKLQDFYARLTNPNAETSKDAIFSALDNLFYNSNVINGSAVADHLTSYGNASGRHVRRRRQRRPVVARLRQPQARGRRRQRPYPRRGRNLRGPWRQCRRHAARPDRPTRWRSWDTSTNSTNVDVHEVHQHRRAALRRRSARSGAPWRGPRWAPRSELDGHRHCQPAVGADRPGFDATHRRTRRTTSASTRATTRPRRRA